MSVTNEISSSGPYDGNNSTVSAYVVTFDFLKNEDLLVKKRLKSNGTETVLTYLTDYTVTGGEGGGAIRTTVAVPNTYEITISRGILLTQPTVFEEGQRIPMKTLEMLFDRTVMQIQRVAGSIGNVVADFYAHVINFTNPHQVTKAQVGLGNVDNTSDANKPVSTAVATELAGKANLIGGNSFLGNQTVGGDVTIENAMLSNSIQGYAGQGVLVYNPDVNFDGDLFRVANDNQTFIAANSNGTFFVSGILEADNYTGYSSGNNTGDQDLSGYALLNGGNTFYGNQTFADDVEIASGISFVAANFAYDSISRNNHKAALNLSGSNTGDQTSIVGITGTKAEFDTACTNGNFAYADAGNTFLSNQTFQSTVTFQDTVTFGALNFSFDPAATASLKGILSLSGTNTGDQTNITGNAGTATALQNTRTIGGSNFNGTANVTSFPSPGAIGGSTPNTGAFTNLSASGTLGVTGQSTLGMTSMTSANFPPGESTRTTTGTTGLLGAFSLVASSTADVTDGFGPTLAFALIDNGVGRSTLGSIAGVRAGGDTTGDVIVQTNSLGVASEVIRFRSNNNVLIGASGDLGTGKLQVTGNIYTTTFVRTGRVTVSGLPSASSNPDARYMVSDSNTNHSTGVGQAVVGGGANIVPVYSNGTNWRIG